MDWDDLYLQAAEQLTEELGRDPLDDEIAERAQSLYESACCDAYDRLKDC